MVFLLLLRLLFGPTLSDFAGHVGFADGERATGRRPVPRRGSLLDLRA